MARAASTAWLLFNSARLELPQVSLQGAQSLQVWAS